MAERILFHKLTDMISFFSNTVFLFFFVIAVQGCSQDVVNMNNMPQAGHVEKFCLFYNFSDYPSPVSMGLGDDYDTTWTKFQNTARPDSSFMINGSDIKQLESRNGRISFIIEDSTFVRFLDQLHNYGAESHSGLFIITLDGERLMPGMFMFFGIAAIPGYPQLRYETGHANVDSGLTLELWGNAYDTQVVDRICGYFIRELKY